MEPVLPVMVQETDQRGIVISTGGKHYLPRAVVLLRVLRYNVNCTLPVELFWVDDGTEMDPVTFEVSRATGFIATTAGCHPAPPATVALAVQPHLDCLRDIWLLAYFKVSYQAPLDHSLSLQAFVDTQHMCHRVVLEQLFLCCCALVYVCLFCHRAVSGPGSRGFRTLDWSGGTLDGTWVDVLLYCPRNPWQYV